ncbi:hypothetical protein L6164_020832 [Bauhinia variegata]|uniref:Uncharacterized protein n=1 Tax=Bauhinia variegata TaxID=167791 RepID=A0ACB9MWG6_BAUVA|nr:hypothetical protein L6164_020832 [Bauhinia variegata]
MTFKKEFKKQMVPEWTEVYMDYECLKRIFKEIISSKEGNHRAAHFRSSQQRLSHETDSSGLHLQNGHQEGGGKIKEQVIDVNALEVDSSRQIYKTNFLNGHEEGEAETRFFRKLDEELNKVNTFYKDQVEAASHEASLLDKQMEALIALRIKVKNHNLDEYIGSTSAETILNNHQENASISGPEVNLVYHNIGNNHHGEEEHGNYKRNDTTDILDHETKNSTSVALDSKKEELSFNKEELRKVEGQLRLVFIEFYQKLLHLKHYSFMNLSAFSKILKKYEKFGNTKSKAASEAYMKVVDNSYLGSSDKVTCLLERVESTFIKNFYHSNHRKGMKLLRPKVKREKDRVTFFIGLFSGCIIALLVASILNSVTQHLMNRQEGTFYMENIFPLYSLFGYITLHMVIYAGNTYFWKRYWINYQFIFGFKPGAELGHREVLLLSTGLAVLGLLGFLVNLHLEMNRRDHNYMTASELNPVALVILVLLITFCPFNIIYRSSRFFFIRCLFRCICAPLYPVTFADFFLADQLTSQFQAFRSFELYICYYGLGEHSRRQSKCQSRGVYNTLYFIVGIIPYWFRLAQCMRQFYDSRDTNRAFNGLNYFSIIVAMVFRTSFELKKKGKTWMVLALTSSAVAALWNLFWDIVMDWGLLRRHSKNPYLRDKLAVPHKSVYYAAMVLDVLLRLSWMQLVLELNWRSHHKVAMITTVSCLEILRRGIWNFFRLENESLNNVGKYRAFKTVPHPFSYYEEHEDDKDD